MELGIMHGATPTPIMADGSLDKDGAEKLCKRLIDIDLDGVLLLGTMGEGPYLPDTTRNDLVEYAADKVKGKVTIFTSVADSSRERMIERAKRYEKMGTDIIVICCTPKVSLGKAIADVKAVA
ncbi:MAG: dihydrodipicolinate synthase family protein [Planctomycetota bacterium]|jgi:4-hydroxy-tetrahydrodipicolinate synthase